MGWKEEAREGSQHKLDGRSAFVRGPTQMQIQLKATLEGRSVRAVSPEVPRGELSSGPRPPGPRQRPESVSPCTSPVPCLRIKTSKLHCTLPNNMTSSGQMHAAFSHQGDTQLLQNVEGCAYGSKVGATIEYSEKPWHRKIISVYSIAVKKTARTCPQTAQDPSWTCSV